MLSLRGDVHKFYLKVKKTIDEDQSVYQLKTIKEIKAIKKVYQKLTVSELTFIRYKMIKEQGGMGIIPLLFGSLPWLGFIFSKQLQALLFKDGVHLWAWFLLIYSIILIAGFIIHYREKAWASLHIEIIEDLINEMQEMESS